MKYGIKRNIEIPSEITTKAVLFRVIRALANAGCLFEIHNGFNGNGRAFYIVNVLGKNSE